MKEPFLTLMRLQKAALSESEFSCCELFDPPTDAFDHAYASRHSVYCKARNTVYGFYVIYARGAGMKPDATLKNEIISEIQKAHK